MEKKSTQEIKDCLKRAEKSLKAARLLFEKEIYPDAASRAYYAMHYAAKAVLLTEDISPKTHKGLVAKFSERIIRMGKLSAKQLKELSMGLNLRIRSDYEIDFEPSKGDISKILADAEDFIDSVKKLIKTDAK